MQLPMTCRSSDLQEAGEAHLPSARRGTAFLRCAAAGLQRMSRNSSKQTGKNSSSRTREISGCRGHWIRFMEFMEGWTSAGPWRRERVSVREASAGWAWDQQGRNGGMSLSHVRDASWGPGRSRPVPSQFFFFNHGKIYITQNFCL